MNNIKPIIYYDNESVQNHNPYHGCLENGNRTSFDSKKYLQRGYKIINPIKNIKHKIILEEISKINPLIYYISKTSFKLNFIQKLFNLKPLSMKQRNCSGCTMLVSDNICPICGDIFNKNKFFRYAYCIDNNIIESDTTYITPTSYNAIHNSISLVCQMIDDIKINKTFNAFAIIRPPGHHASNTKSEGFCLINNIAICAKYALLSGYKKIFIFDFDAHHGNGTQNIFYSQSNVYYCSIHTLSSYPKTGLVEEKGYAEGYGYNLNIVVEKGIDTESYLNIYKNIVLPTIDYYKPDIILVSAGFDGLSTDPMKIMNLTPECYGEIALTLTSYNIPVCMILEGGYDLEMLSKCYDTCLKYLVV